MLEFLGIALFVFIFLELLNSLGMCAMCLGVHVDSLGYATQPDRFHVFPTLMIPLA